MAQGKTAFQIWRILMDCNRLLLRVNDDNYEPEGQIQNIQDIFSQN
jgi:hypothetical protein